MIKKLLATTALAVIFAGLSSGGSIDVASAADLAMKPADPIAPVAAPFDWTGPYVGLHAGYGWGKEHDDLSENGVGAPTGPTGDNFSLSGFIGGAHAGYNYQFANQFVLGVEGDIDYSNLNGDTHFTNPAPGTIKFKTEWQGSARLRAGYAIDNFLLYATGGIAFANAELKVNGSSDTNTHFGWTVGAGAEYAFTQNWIGRAEVRYSDFNKQGYDTSFGRVKADFNETTATLGVSYKF
jgi:outer membrane immunogenic protein